MYVKVRIEKMVFFTLGQIIEAGDGGRRLRIVEEFETDPHAGGFTLEVDLNDGDGFRPSFTGILQNCQAEARGLLEQWLIDTIKIDPDEEEGEPTGEPELPPIQYIATYATGRNRSDRDNGGTLLHAVEVDDLDLVGVAWSGSWVKSVCGYTPGKRSNGWGSYVGDGVTCPKCAKKLTKRHKLISRSDFHREVDEARKRIHEDPWKYQA